MTSEAYYNYELKINEVSAIFKSGVVAENFPNIGKLIFYSENFSDLEECESKFNALVLTLVSAETNLSSASPVIVQRVNPILSTEEDEMKIKFEPWDRHTVARVYVFPPEEINNEQPSYIFFGHIRSSREILGVKEPEKSPE